MSNNTWNFPCYNCCDLYLGREGGGDAGRGATWAQGPGNSFYIPGQTLPYTESFTAIFSALIRSGGWSARGGSGVPQGVWSMGTQGNTGVGASYVGLWNVGTQNPLIRYAMYGSGGVLRYQLDLGDEDVSGTKYLKNDKFYQVGLSCNASGITWAVNGSQSGNSNLSTNNPGALAMDSGTPRIWTTGPGASEGSGDPLFLGDWWPTVVIGASVYSTQYLDFDSQTVRDRIWDANGDFKNPGEDGSLWFDDTYGAVQPYHYHVDGTPRFDRGTGGQVWTFLRGGSSADSRRPGGMRKQYEVPRPWGRMMTFDGIGGYYDETVQTYTGNLVWGVCKFNVASFSGGGQPLLINTRSDNKNKLYVALVANDHVTVARRGKMIIYVQDSTGATACLLVSTSVLADGADHVVFITYDGDNGTAVFRVDEADEDDAGAAGRVLGTATLPTGGVEAFSVGGSSTGTDLISGDIGFVGYADAHLTNYADFSTGNVIKEIDEWNWTEFGGNQPLFWERDGNLFRENLGSAFIVTKNGTVTGPT